MHESLAAWCRREKREELLWQWHPEKNEGLSPDTVPYGSKKKVWWRCERGHEWPATVCNRSSAASRCPYCSGRRPWPGENDLATLMPDLMAQWHPMRNAGLDPGTVSPGSKRKAWWICEYGHEWQAEVKSRVNGAGCPYCANRSIQIFANDLATTHPHLAAQWHPVKNGSLRPRAFVAGGMNKVWWRCEKGHEWQAQIHARAANGSGCPVCSGRTVLKGENDLASLFPDLARQWHPEKNRPLTPSEVTPNSNRKVWWRCDHGHEWQTTVALRSRRSSDCPVCSGRRVEPGLNDLATLFPQVAAQWDMSLNGSLRPQQVSPGSSRKVWWRCGEGHVWKAVVSSRTGKRMHGCPVCAGRVKRISYGERAESLRADMR